MGFFYVKLEVTDSNRYIFKSLEIEYDYREWLSEHGKIDGIMTCYAWLTQYVRSVSYRTMPAAEERFSERILSVMGME